jgi:fructose-bisphosphate aldolase, class II
MRCCVSDTGQITKTAFNQGLVVPAFNIPYLPMMEPVIQAIVENDSFALIETARLEWIKFEAGGPQTVIDEYRRWQRSDHVRLHLDHVPVIDEDNRVVDYLEIIQEALDLGYDSVMVDGSRLSLEENIAATRKAVELAHQAGVPCEAELGAVLGHESGPLPPYDELFASGRGFTDVAEAERFVREAGCDWLSVAIGNIHGAISGAAKDKKKVQARLNIVHLEKLREITQLPLVLHGGSGVTQKDLLSAVKKGIAKVNVGSEIRQAYEVTLAETGLVSSAQKSVYERTNWLIRDYFLIHGSREWLLPNQVNKI